MVRYECQLCGKEVKEMMKACDCKAPIVANISATARGQGGVR